MPHPPAPTPVPPAPADVDLQSLGLVALHRLAQQGHDAARAELERRMRAPQAGQVGRAAPKTPSLSATRAAAVPRRAVAQDTAASRALTPPAPATTTPAPQVEAAVRDAQAQAEQLQLMAQLTPDAQSVDGPPRLVGLVMLIWGVLLSLGGLILAAQTGNVYYVFCGLACAAVGYLLMRTSRFALHAHLASLAVALAWAWVLDRNTAAALTGALPLLVPLLWLAVPAVREPLS